MKETNEIYAIYALYISLGALIVSVFSLGWNFYRDIILKPRLKVRAAISNVAQAGRDVQTFISVSAVNQGPGAIICNGILGMKRHLLRFWKKGLEKKYFYIVEDYTNPLNKPFPQKLEVGDTLTQFLRYKQDAFLSLDPSYRRKRFIR